MHEAALTQGLMKILMTEAQRHQVTRITRVRLKIGTLRAVEPQSMAFCFNAFADGTLAQDAELVIDVLPAMAQCQHCGSEFVVIKFHFQCDRCQSREVQLIQGNELYIESFDA